MVILDTCAIIEICKKNPSFSKKITKLMNKESHILSISFAEIACKIKIGKLEMEVTPHTLFSEFQKIENTTIVDITTELWLQSIDLNWADNKDPADRLITSFAIQHNCPIVTTDNKIKKFYKNVVW